jgi:hypothetical protein
LERDCYKQVTEAVPIRKDRLLIHTLLTRPRRAYAAIVQDPHSRTVL